MKFYYQCEDSEIEFLDNARAFPCPYDEAMREKPYKYTGMLVRGNKEGYGL